MLQTYYQFKIICFLNKIFFPGNRKSLYNYCLKGTHLINKGQLMKVTDRLANAAVLLQQTLCKGNELYKKYSEGCYTIEFTY